MLKIIIRYFGNFWEFWNLVIKFYPLPGRISTAFADDVRCIFCSDKQHSCIYNQFFLYGDSLTTPGQSTDVAAAGTVGREHAVVDPLLALDASVASEAHA